MKRLILILFFLNISVFAFSQTEKQGFIVNYSEKSYLVCDSLSNLFPDLKHMDFVYFNDWSFLDSLRHKLEGFYNRNLGYDTLNKKIGGITLLVDTSGKIVYFLLIIPNDCGDLYSLSDTKELTDLLKNYHFKFSDYKRPVVRRYQGSNRETRMDTFQYFNVIYSTNGRGGVFSSWDGLYERQLTKMLLGTWTDEKGDQFVFNRPSTRIYLKMQNSFPGLSDEFRCKFRDGRLYIYFDEETPSSMSYKFQGDRLTLEGLVENQKVVWNLKRLTSTP